MTPSAHKPPIPACRAGFDTSDIHLLIESAEQAAGHGAYAEAITLAENVVHQAVEGCDAATSARANGLLVMLYRRQGRPEEAIVAGHAALSVLGTSGNHALHTEVLCHMTMCFNELRLFPDALHLVSDAVVAAQRSGDRRLLCWAYNRVGTTNGFMGRFTEARHFLLEALTIARELGAAEEMFAALNNLVCALGDEISKLLEAEAPDHQLVQSKVQLARSYGNEAIALARITNNKFQEAGLLGTLGPLFAIAGDLDDASQMLHLARKIASDHGYPALLQLAEVGQAKVATASGNPEEAVRLLTPLLTPEVSVSDIALELHRHLYRAEKSCGNFAAALKQHEIVLTMTTREHDQRADVQTRLMLNRLELDQAKFATERAQMELRLQRAHSEQLATEARDLSEKAKQLGRFAMEDPLTGLGNRRLMDRDIPLMLEDAYRNSRPTALAIVDIDHFKKVNDVHGHQIGDSVLKRMGEILRLHARSGDLVARMGGEEFVVVLARATPTQAVDVCERLRIKIQSFEWDRIARGMSITISVGLCLPLNGSPVERVIADADDALYKAKRGGRNRVVMFETEAHDG